MTRRHLSTLAAVVLLLATLAALAPRPAAAAGPYIIRPLTFGAKAPLSGAPDGAAQNINNLGHAVGYANDLGTYRSHAFLYVLYDG